MKKIVFISDIHIRNVSRFEEYSKVFTTTIKQIKYLKPDYIFNGGDTFHQKLTLSPESIILARKFFLELGKICPVYSIIGNHDCNVNNLDRLDAVSSVLQDIPNNFVIKYSGIYKIDNELNIGLCSILDDQSKWPMTGLDTSKINIGLYHGALVGAVNDQNFKLESSTLSPSLFKEYDFVFAGDIHSYFPYGKDVKNPRLWSIGNLIQQNFGEAEKKGFLYLEIEDKDNFKLNFEQVKNDYNYITIHLNEEQLVNNKKTIKETLKKLHVTKHTNLRIIFNTEKIISEDHKNNIKHYIVDGWNIDVVFTEKSNVLNSNEELKDLGGKVLNFNDVNTQNKLLENYIKHKEEYKNLLKDKENLFKINRNINESLGYTQLDRHNLNWMISEIQFDNMFCFKKNNNINFNNLNGIIGLYGPNAAGKSSIFNIITFAIFGKTLKKISMLNILNHDANSGFVKILLKKGNFNYRITRNLIANKHKTAAKNSVEFEIQEDGQWNTLNEETVPMTNKKITEFFGDLNEFIMTSMSTQDNYNIFIDLGNTDRKEIIMRYLGLGIYQKLYEKTTEEIKLLKAQISSIDNFEEDLTELKSYKTKLRNLRTIEKRNKKEIIILKKEIKILISEEKKVKNKVKQIVIPEISIETLKKIKTDNLDFIKKLTPSILKDINMFKEKKIDLKTEKKYLEKIAEANNKKISLETESRLLKLDIENKEEYGSIDCDVAACPLLVKYNLDKSKDDRIIEIANELSKITNVINVAKKQLFNINEAKKNKDSILTKKDHLKRAEQTVKDTKKKILQINDNKEIAKENNKLEILVAQINKNLISKTIDQNRYEAEIESNKTLEEEYLARIDVIDTNIKKVSDIKKEYEILDKYKNIINPNALPNTLLHNYLNKFEAEVNRILNDATGLYIETKLIKKRNNKSVDLDIQYKSRYGSKYLPIELASGAEKLFLSIAIRVGLIKLTSLQKTDTLIIDEGFSSLHVSNINRLKPYFDAIKENFKRIILVTHIEQIQDLPDTVINIHKDKTGTTQINI